jgi:hypothetical protein
VIILAIDPGSEQSAWVAYGVASGVLRSFAREPNEQLLTRLREAGRQEHVDRVVIEWTAPRGMPASAQLFETLWWAGRFAEAARPLPVERLKRLDVKRHICGRTNATDTNIRAALIDRYGGVGGKRAAIGLKASPGPLYGVSKDVWAALAVACTWADQRAAGEVACE